ncbi:hypothetical protein GCM10007904_38290 [Oharaeibacter diazotrophicus]|nr:hypothetical protein GCM10007904_38290 [Oharaeibacter diazotrophicus]
MVAAVLLAVAAVVSTVRGLQVGLAMGTDLQWSPARVFLSGRDPYALWLGGDPSDEIILKQVPNYLHVLYVAMAPLAAMDFVSARAVWAFGNLVLGVGLVLVLARRFGLDGARTALLLGLFMAGTPFRIGLELGQTALVAMAFLILPFLGPPFPGRRGAFALQGMGYAKYSFAPPFLLYGLLRHGPVALAGLIVPAAGFAVFCWWTGTSPFVAALEPLTVAGRNLGVTTADFMAVAQRLFGRHTVVSGTLALALCAVLVHAAARHPDEELHLPLVALISLACFKHHVYDYAILLPVLAYALRPGEVAGRLPILLVTAWFWLGRQAVEMSTAPWGYAGAARRWMVIPGFVVLVALIVHLLRTDAAGRRVRWPGFQGRQKAVAGSSAARSSAAEP